MLAVDQDHSVEAFTASVADGAESGVDLRLDTSPGSLYFRLRDARSQARAAERAAEYEPDAGDGAGRAWGEVRKLASEALTGTTKDIEIASWLTESLVRSDGLRGLATGARVLAGLVTGFWDAGLHPQPDEDGFEARLAAVAGLNGSGSDGTLMQPLRRIALFERADGTPLPVWQFEQAEGVAGLADPAKQTQRAAGIPPFAEIEGEAQAGGRAALAVLGQDAEAALGAWQDLEAVLDKAAGRDAPPMRRVGELLRKILRISLRYAPRPESPAIAAEQGGDSPAAAPDGAATAAHPPSEHPDREALLGEITRIAALFRLREPNSPLSYTLDNAVRRARLAWPELLREMLPEVAPRAAVLSGLGIVPPPE